jgi:hypothetical protein
MFGFVHAKITFKLETMPTMLTSPFIVKGHFEAILHLNTLLA